MAVAQLANQMKMTPQPEAKTATMTYPWFALQVRVRHESSVADYLGGLGYEWFLPLYKSRKRWSGTTTTLHPTQKQKIKTKSQSKSKSKPVNGAGAAERAG